MNKATLTRFKNWIIATNPNLKLNESVSTNSIYLESDEIRIRISDHMPGLSKVKRFDISIVIPEESKQYIASVGFKVYIYDNLAVITNVPIIPKEDDDKNVFVSEKYAKAALALAQISQLMPYYGGEITEEWKLLKNGNY